MDKADCLHARGRWCAMRLSDAVTQENGCEAEEGEEDKRAYDEERSTPHWQIPRSSARDHLSSKIGFAPGLLGLLPGGLTSGPVGCRVPADETGSDISDRSCSAQSDAHKRASVRPACGSNAAFRSLAHLGAIT